MDAPKCKLCGERHRLGPCPRHQRESPLTLNSGALRRADGKPLTAGDLAVGSSYEVTEDRTVKPLNPTAVAAAKRAAPGTFDRNAYQRDLMRKRRAAVKAKP